MKQRMIMGLFVLLSGLYFGSASPVSAQESFYKGKSIRLIVGSTPRGIL
jgi:hypothetical protein